MLVSPAESGDEVATGTGARGPRERRMASRVAVRSAGRGERAGTVRLPSPEPPLGDGGTREAHPSERRRTGEPLPARLGFPRPGHGTTEFREGHEVGARAPSMRTATSMASIMLSGLAMPFHVRS